MNLAAGARLGKVEIHSLIGAGGMGEVYRARDTRLKRDIAVKVLPAVWASDADRLARFQREAELLATLNHPNVAAIYGLEDADGIHALLLELVEGPSLADRLRRGPIPVTEALSIARQIADALDAAHARGIVHRDLKPANIKVRDDGMVKVLDFGLAKTLGPEPSAGAETQLPTLTDPGLTRGGMILGTPAYMSPEQARGQVVDKRTDIWAFGCVLYEMLTGRAAFARDTITDTLAAVVEREPDWVVLPEATPAGLRRLLRRCLEKDPKRRLRDAADARLEIDEAADSQDRESLTPFPDDRTARRWRLTAVVALAVSATALAVLAWRTNEVGPDVTGAEMRLNIVTPPSASVSDFAISPDGQTLVFQSAGQLWLRPLHSEAAQPLAGTESGRTTGGTRPFWSPDSRSLGFFADGQLKRIDVGTGVVRTLAVSGTSNGGAWSRDGVILYGSSSTGPLYRVPAAGGESAEATSVSPPGQAGHRYPQFLPDGRHFLFLALGTPEKRGLYVGSLDSDEARRLFDADSAAVFAPPDRVMFARQGVLLAQRIELNTFTPVGDPITVAGQVVVDAIGATFTGASYFSVALSASAVGSVAYRAAAGTRQLVWLDRTGRQLGAVGDPDASPGDARTMRLSPDGQYVALDRIVRGNRDIWLVETERGVLRRFTFDAERETEPIWSPDGRHILFMSLQNGLPDLYEKPIESDDPASLVLSSPEFKNLYDWSSDGRYILFTKSLNTGRDLWALPRLPGEQPLPVANTPFEERGGRFSPDGRWVAYQSDESGRSEVYVQPFPRNGPRVQISRTGGDTPKWRRDGRELFYLAGNRLMAVPVMPSGSTVTAGTPVTLFSVPPGFAYAPAPDGQRFLVSRVLEDAAPITVILNWKPGQAPL